MKRLLVFFVVVMTVFTASAQFSLGVKGGLNIVNVNFTPVVNGSSESGYRSAYHGGIYEQYNVTDKFSVRAELLYSNKGVRFEASSNPPLSKTNINLHYLSLPLLAQYRIWNQLSVAMGPEISYLLSATSRSADGRSDVGFIYDRKIDVGIAGGLGYQISEKVDIGARYIYGLLNVVGDLTLTDEQGTPIDVNPTSQNRTFQFSVGYRVK